MADPEIVKAFLESNKRNVDIILVNKKVLLKLLQFEGGIIHDIRMNPDRWNPDEIEIVLEHPDLHEVQDGYTLLRVTPTYLDKMELIDGVDFHHIERIDPPKGVTKDGQKAH